MTNEAWKNNNQAVVQFVAEEIGSAFEGFKSVIDEEVRKAMEGELGNLIGTDSPCEVSYDNRAKHTMLAGSYDRRPPTMSARLAMQIKELKQRLSQLEDLQSELEKQPQVQGLLDRLSQLHI